MRRESFFNLKALYTTVLREILIQEFLRDAKFSEKDKVVVLGEVTLTKQLCIKAKKQGINVKSSNDIDRLEKILRRYRKIINKRNYIFVLTDKKYLRWMDVLDQNKIPCTRYVVLPLFMAEKC